MAPSACSRRHVFTRTLVGRGGSWWTRSSQAARGDADGSFGCDTHDMLCVTRVTRQVAGNNILDTSDVPAYIGVMATANSTPDTLLGAINYFADIDVATQFVAGLRWPEGVECPHCESKDVAFVQSR